MSFRDTTNPAELQVLVNATFGHVPPQSHERHWLEYAMSHMEHYPQSCTHIMFNTENTPVFMFHEYRETSTRIVLDCFISRPGTQTGLEAALELMSDWVVRKLELGYSVRYVVPLESRFQYQQKLCKRLFGGGAPEWYGNKRRLSYSLTMQPGLPQRLQTLARSQ